MPPSVIVSSLCLQLQRADAIRADVEHRVGLHIIELLPGWTGDWVWSPPGSIEVYGANHAPHEVANAELSLRFAGFTDVRIHNHTKAERLLSCTCRWRTTR